MLLEGMSQSPSISLAGKMSGNFAKSMSFFHRMPHIVLIMMNILDRLERWSNIFGPVTPVVVVVVVVVAAGLVQLIIWISSFQSDSSPFFRFLIFLQKKHHLILQTFLLLLKILGSRFNLADLSRTICSCFESDAIPINFGHRLPLLLM